MCALAEPSAPQFHLIMFMLWINREPITSRAVHYWLAEEELRVESFLCWAAVV